MQIQPMQKTTTPAGDQQTNIAEGGDAYRHFEEPAEGLLSVPKKKTDAKREAEKSDT